MRLAGYAGLLCLLGVVYASTKQTMAPEAKKQQIRDLASQAKSHVISLDDNTFPYYAVQKPRPYSLVVFLTAAHPKFRCTVCRDLDREFSLLAESYAKNRPAELKEDETEVFFVRLDYESSQTVFQNYGVTSVPMIFHVAPFRGEKNMEDYQLPARDRFQIPNVPDAESLASFVRERTGAHIPIKRSMFTSYVTLLLLFGGLAAAVRPIINNLSFWLALIRTTSLWTFISLAVYTCAISGMIYDIIRSPSLYHMNPSTGQIMFFYPQSGSQFVVEGFVIGFLNLGCAVAVLVLTLYVPKMKQKGSDATSWRTITFFGCTIVFYVCFSMVKGLYRMKNRWYRG